MEPERFEREASKSIHERTEEHKIGFKNKYQFSGKYGVNLMEEVGRYAVVAATIAGQQQFDVIHAHDWLTYPAGIAAKRVSGKPLVVHVHATEFDRSGENINTLVYNIERQGMEEADRVVTVSNWTRDIVIRRYGIRPEKVVTIHNAVDFQSYSDMKVERGVKEKVVTFLGRITYQKGPEYFIEAAYKVLQRYSNVRFVMAGSGDLMDRSIRRVAKLKIATKFHFTGFLRGQDVQKMFAYSDVYVMPSVSEPFGEIFREYYRIFLEINRIIVFECPSDKPVFDILVHKSISVRYFIPGAFDCPQDILSLSNPRQIIQS